MARMAAPARVLTLLALMIPMGTACGRAERQEDGYAGTWVMRAGEHVLFVLTLAERNGEFTGSLQRPRNFQANSGLSYSNISGGTVSERIVSASPDASVLRIVTEGSGGASDRSEYVLTLVGTERVSLVPEGWPLEPWGLTRIRGAEAPRVFEGWQADQSYAVDQTDVPSNPKMQAIFEADQAVRQSLPTPEQLDKMRAGDADRRAQTKALIDQGELHSGKDFNQAAFVFQHGERPEEFLYAHALATIALAKGDPAAAWIAAATLDRYLQSIGQPQIYGTQFTFPTATGANDSTFSEPFNRELISDALRRQAGVLALEDQLSMMRQSQAAAEKPAPPATPAR